MFRCDYTDCKQKGNRQEVIMNTMDSAAAISSTREDSLKKLVFAGIFAALTYIVFTFLSIPIPTIAGDKVTVHLGNAFCVLGALILGSFYGGAGGALGLTIADLMDPVYIVQAPITFVIKFLMGILVGAIAHRMGHISTKKDLGKVFRWTVAAVAAGLLFNAVCDPTIRYFYKILILGKPAAEVSFAINIGVTAINSVVSAFIATGLYMSLRAPLKKTGLFFYF